MKYVAVDRIGDEWIYNGKPERQNKDNWIYFENEGHAGFSLGACFHLPDGSIEKLIGNVITWEDEPVELKEV